MAHRHQAGVVVLGPVGVTRDAVVAVLTAGGHEVQLSPVGAEGEAPPAAPADRVRVAVLVEPGPGDWAAVAALGVPAVVVEHRARPGEVPEGVEIRGVLGPDAPSGDVLAAVDVALRSAGGARAASTPTPVRDGATTEPAIVLTLRERQILDAIEHGLSVKQTARALGIAPKTVENLQGRLFAKLGARNRAQAVFLAHELGLLDGTPEGV